MSRKKVAIVGGGVSGISCCWNLRHSGCDVHLFEADARLGGHANSVHFKQPNGFSTPVETGFMAISEETYRKRWDGHDYTPLTNRPTKSLTNFKANFVSFLDTLHIKTLPSPMSFAVSMNNGAFEWSSVSILDIFLANPWNVINPRFWRLILDILRFNYFAPSILSEEDDHSASDVPGTFHDWEAKSQSSVIEPLESIGAYLQREGYSDLFRNGYLIPMVASFWCVDPEVLAQSFPATTVVRYMWSHRLLETHKHTLRWRTIENGSQSYYDAVLKALPPTHQIHRSSPVTSVQRQGEGYSVMTASGRSMSFDYVVLATSAKRALHILGNEATKQETELLRVFQTQQNTCVLHSDSNLLPQRREARAAYNFVSEEGIISWTSLPTPKDSEKQPSHPLLRFKNRLSVTFDMRTVHNLPRTTHGPSSTEILVTMNPNIPPQASTIQGSYHWDTPIMTSDSVLAQERLHEINGRDGVLFAGAWTGFGFHEDGYVSGLQAANHVLQAEGREAVPVTARFRRRGAPAWALTTWFVRTAISLTALIFWR